MTSHILGLSAYYHDSAACLLRDGEIVAAAQEERFTRKKGDAAFPQQAVAYCLRAGGIEVGDLGYVGFYDKPLLKFERILETYLGIAPRGFRSFLMAGPLWIKDKLYLDKQLRKELDYSGDIFYADASVGYLLMDMIEPRLHLLFASGGDDAVGPESGDTVSIDKSGLGWLGLSLDVGIKINDMLKAHAGWGTRLDSAGLNLPYGYVLSGTNTVGGLGAVSLGVSAEL